MIVLFMVVILLTIPMFVYAHPAAKVTLSIEGKVLNVTINHNVGNSENHYIDEIIVLLNDKEIIKQIFSTQIDNVQKVSYTIPSLKIGDKITVKTNCSRGGKRSGTITVEPAS